MASRKHHDKRRDRLEFTIHTDNGSLDYFYQSTSYNLEGTINF